jgi:site-specific recombinase XerD
MSYKLAEMTDTFMTYLEYEKNVSPKTLENYGLWMRRFIEHHGNKDVSGIKPMDVLMYRKHLDTTL